ncbi:MAG: aldo/keto reductase [Planctomycetes bacterium]|nr:aldo/keto reductase [Planctomycetota bacterium]
MNEHRLSRRTFIRNTSLMAVGSVAAGLAEENSAAGEPAGSIDTSKILNYNPQMGYRRLGKTGLLISEVSLGGHWVNREGVRYWIRFPQDVVPPDVAKNRIEVVSRCIDRGINFVDPVTYAELAAYGVSLQGRRDKMYVAASSDAMNPNRREHCTLDIQRANIDDCLKRLGTDYLDVWRPMFRQDGKHPDSDVEVCVEAFEKAHQQGKARWLGMSSHNRAFVQHVVEKFPQFSMVIFPYTAKSKVKTTDAESIDPARTVEVGTGDGLYSGDTRKSIFAAVQKQDVGVVTIKPFAGGSLFRTKLTFGEMESSEEDYERARLTLAYILCNPAITATIPGMSSIEEVDNNARASAERLAMFDRHGVEKLRASAEEMWASLPREYDWLRDWEWI